MIIFLYGQDHFRSIEKLAELKKKFLKEVDPSGFNLIELEGEKLTIDDFHSSVSSISFLARKRMVLVRDLITKNRNKTIFKDILELLDSYSNQSDNTIIVFWESNPSAKNTLFKHLKSSQYVSEFKPLNINQLSKWIIMRVTENNGKINTDAVSLLSQYTGSDLYIVNNEIQKLVNFAKDSIISTKDVENIVSAQFNDVIFNFIDALCAKDGERAYRLLHEQIEAGTNELYILTMLIRQFRILIILKTYTEKSSNINRFELSKKFQLHPFVVQKSLSQIVKFTTEDLIFIYQYLMKIDEKIKTTQVDINVLFDLLLAHIV